MVCLLCFPLRAESRFEFKQGDRILFYGDSITQQNLYTMYLECLLNGANPGLDLHFINMGWGGNQASDALARFDRDVLPNKPTIVFVNFGMNDGHYVNFNDQAYQDYRKNMTALVDRLQKETQAKIVLMTTTPVDSDTNPPLNKYNDTALSLFSEFVNDIGRQRGIVVVDQFQKFLQLQKHRKAQVIGTSLIPDGVHPNARGHLWTTYFALKDLGLGFKSQCEIAADTGKVVQCEGCKVEGLEVSPERITFTREDMGIPLYLYPGLERKIDEDIPFNKDINNLGLRVTGLSGERYGVLADGMFVGGFTTGEFANGVNLTERFRGPWATAGEKLRRLSLQKFRLHFLEWREIRTGGLFDEAPPAEDIEAFRAASAKLYDYIQSLQWKAAKPKPVKFEIVPSRALDVPEWLTTGPYHAVDAELLDFKFDPETKTEGIDWRAGLKPVTMGEVNLNTFLDKDRGRCAYVRYVFKGRKEETLHVSIGSLGSAKVFFNGVEVAREPVDQRNPPREKDLELPLVDGDNAIMLKVLTNGNAWAYYFRGEILSK